MLKRRKKYVEYGILVLMMPTLYMTHNGSLHPNGNLPDWVVWGIHYALVVFTVVCFMKARQKRIKANGLQRFVK